MLNKKITLFFILLSLNGIAQNIQLSKIISENKIANYNNQKLILLDFWATWCAPCLPATQQLEIVQEYNKDKIFIISVTDETEEKVLNFLKRNPIQLAVAIDSKDSNISKYRVTSRPYSVLLDCNGNYLWKGHPADLTKWVLNKYYEKTKDNEVVNYSKLIKFDAKVEKVKNVLNVISIKDLYSDDQIFSIEDGNVLFTGKIANLISELKDLSITDIEINEKINKTIELKCSENDWNNKEHIINLIEDKYQLNITSHKKNVDATEIILENDNLLWDKNQIVWEDNPIHYIIGNDRISANDVTISKIAQILSEAKNKYYVYKGKNNKIYDWDFQYLYDDLMIDEMENSFGIKFKDIKTDKDFYIISSK